jgi:hypothetical protein
LIDIDTGRRLCRPFSGARAFAGEEGEGVSVDRRGKRCRMREGKGVSSMLVLVAVEMWED